MLVSSRQPILVFFVPLRGSHADVRRYDFMPSQNLTWYDMHTRRTTLGDRAFPVTAARAWNALPSSVRSAPSLLQFRRDFKTALHVSVIVLFTIVSSCVTDCNCNL